MDVNKGRLDANIQVVTTFLKKYIAYWIFIGGSENKKRINKCNINILVERKRREL